MKKLILSLLILPLLFFIALPIDDVIAISGACSWHGGVNCAAGPDWDGSVICNDGWKDSSVSYYSMVKCQSYYDYDYPSYSPSIPDCPSNSYYDSISGSCKCYSGYVVSGGKCISADQYCRDLYGFNARHNILTDSCECSYGYVFSGNRCVNGDSYCRGKYGIHSSYNSLSESCKCDYGYVFNSSNQCVSRDDYCQDLYGYYSEYNILTGSCICKDGYKFKGSTCVKIKPVIYSFSPTTVKAGETVTVSGNNFGEYKGNVILNTLSFGTLGRISSLDIKSWSDNTIKFIVPESKEPDQYYIRIEPSLTFSSEEAVSKSRLEVLGSEEDYIPFYSFEATQESQQDSQPDSQLEPQSSEGPQLEPESESQLEQEFTSSPQEETQMETQQELQVQSESESQIEKKSQSELESQGVEEGQQEEIESKQEQKESIWMFLANIFTAVKNFFYGIFH